ncbi:PREDICTED: uncharacterized protein LOC109291933 isoform X1 [Gavialis gangeticus]|uniref:uncharacterized protein LOC109291933 isoform X1 n=1 Tax=Gavialis gangeticus TaxID=94835 RepID=UPI00092F93D3|nr:PREDICTED: uncharacterized protein LOC109291933 isoform X1 [Gavialis gangeticus]
MSTAKEGEAKPGDAKPEDAEPEKKIFYCEICKVPCMSSISLQSHYRGVKHKKRERAMNPYRAPAPVMHETARPVKRKLTKDITCLKDFMQDPKREEPLVGLEHVVEIRFAGRREPHYECKLCDFNTQMAPMIEHLSGYKHRRAYVAKEYPDKIKKNMPAMKEDKVSFFRRIAREIEKTEGLKMFKTEGYTRPSTSSSSKKKARWETSYKPENDPVWKERALQFLETFRITSDSEATQVVSITQNLTEALRAFCEKKAAVNYVSSLRPLMSISYDQLVAGKGSQKQKPYGNYQGNSGNANWNQGFSPQRSEQAKFTSHYSANTSLTPSSSYSYKTSGGSSAYGHRANDSASMSALSNSLALETGGFATGISEWMKKVDQSVFPSTSTGGNPSNNSMYSTSAYSRKRYCNDAEGNESQIPDRMTFGTESTNWRNRETFRSIRNFPDEGSSYSNSSVMYPLSPPRGYSENCAVKDSSPYYSHASTNSAFSLGGGSNWAQESSYQKSRYQQSRFRTNSSSCDYSFSGSNLYRDYQPSRESELNFDGDSSSLSPNIVDRSEREDMPTMTSVFKRLTPYYPVLQSKIFGTSKVLVSYTSRPGEWH